jgi:NAD(P)-dependent dehydrogenase (short-subunit alcohol dehydrogenase family)
MAADKNLPVLITGCSSGIGRALAQSLPRQGFLTYATARNPATIADLEGVGCKILPLDVTLDSSMTAAVDAILTKHGGIGALINNAGYALPGAVEDLDLEAVRREFDTNVFGAVRLTQLVIPGMRARRQGTIVNMSSMGGTLTFPGGGAYHASKYALEAFSDALRFELGGYGIDVVVIQPGLVLTSFGKTAHANVTSERMQNGPNAAFNRAVAESNVQAYKPGSGAGKPEDVAKLVGRVLATRRPKSRYRVLPTAHIFMTLRSLLPDRMWDKVMSKLYPRPGHT